MRKAMKFAIFTIAISIAAFGCTTNRTHSEGEPYIGVPSVGPSVPTSNTGGTSVSTTPPPMTSSYRGNDQVLVSRPHRLTPDEAALVMADHLPRVRVLGTVNPGGPRPYVSDGMVTGQVVNSAAIVNPGYVTVNSSLNSPGAGAITVRTLNTTNANSGNVSVLSTSGKVMVTNVGTGSQSPQ